MSNVRFISWGAEQDKAHLITVTHTHTHTHTNTHTHTPEVYCTLGVLSKISEPRCVIRIDVISFSSDLMKQACCLAYGHLSVYVRLVLCLQESLFVCVVACVCVRACVCVCLPCSAQVPAALNVFDLRHKCDFVSIVIRCCNKIS